MCLVAALIVVDRFAAAAPPANDDFTSRKILSGASARDEVSNNEATYESGERNHGALSGTAWTAKTVWWSWTAPGDGIVTMDTLESSFDTILAVYIGGRLPELKAVVASDDVDDSTTRSKVTFPVTAGRIYQVVVDGSSASGANGTVVLRIEFSQDPRINDLNLPTEASVANDEFVDRVLLTGTNVSAIAYNLDASYVTGEPNHGLYADSSWLAKTVWWAWRAPGNGRAIITTAGSTDSGGRALDTLLAVYIGGTISALDPVVANDNIEEFVRTSQVSFPVTSNRIYQIVVDGNSATDMTGNIVVNVALDPAPDIATLNLPTEAAVGNDLFANRVLLTGSNVSAIGYNTGASYETGEPAHAPNWLAKTLWWSWRTDSSDEVSISTDGSSFDTILAVYTNSTLATLEPVARNDDIDVVNRSSLVRFTPIPGRIYQIAVDGNSTSRDYGSILLHIRQHTGLSPSHVRIFRAVEVEFSPVAGSRYRLQRSIDLVNWAFEGEAFTGGDAPHRFLLSTEGRPHENYRFILLP